MTSYDGSFFLNATGLAATLDDIHNHLVKLSNETDLTIEVLGEYMLETLDHSERLHNVDDIVFFIECMTEEFIRFKNIFDRLLNELPKAVEPKHPVMVKELVGHSRDLDEVCLEFKRQHIERPLKDESIRWLIDQIYKESRSQLLTYRNLSGLALNVETYVGTINYDHSVSSDDLDAFELKPNFFGVGINLNYIIKRLIQRWKKGSIS